jgi:hypothetical protein
MLGTLVLLALAPAPQAAAPAETVTIAAAPARIGDDVHVVSTVETRYAVLFTVGGAKLRDFERRTVDTRSFDARLVPGAAGGPGNATPASVRIAYGECRSVLTEPSGENVEKLPVERRHYVVGLVDRSADGRVPTEARMKVQELDVTKNETLDVDEGVAAQVARDAGELLLGGRFATFLAGKPLAVAQPLDVPQDVARTLLGGVLDGVTVQSFTLTPKRPGTGGDASGDVAFTAALSVTMKQRDDLSVTSTFELTGEIVLGRAHGRLVALDLAGPIRFGGSKEEGATRIEVTGTGTLTWQYRSEPLAPR